MKNINYKQLAFILDIKPVEAIEKIIHCHCKETGKTLPYPRYDKVKDYTSQDWPQEIEVDIFQKHSGISLGSAILDIQDNYLKRPASKKWILCDFPEKELQTKPKNRIKIPSALASLLNKESLATIKQEWHERYGI